MQPIQQLKAEFFRALAHPARIRILEVLSAGERPVSELIAEVGLESSHLSQQLGVLRRANLVASRKEGTSVVYWIIDDRLVEILHLAKDILLAYLTQTSDLLADAARIRLSPPPKTGRVRGDDVARKGRARRFREARQLEQGYDDRAPEPALVNQRTTGWSPSGTYRAAEARERLWIRR